MNEAFTVEFQRGGAAVNVRTASKTSVVFDQELDASPVEIAYALQHADLATKFRMDTVRRNRGWEPDKFFLKLTVDSGRLKFSGVDKNALPAGRYTFAVRASGLVTEPLQAPLEVRKNSTSALQFHFQDRFKLSVVEVAKFDPVTAGIIGSEQSNLDGMDIATWLGSQGPRIARKACLLNLLAQLRCTPSPQESLASKLEYIRFADVDRIYAGVSDDIVQGLQAACAQGTFVHEGVPAAAIHQDLLTRMNADRKDYTLDSYRQGGRNCLQLVIAKPNQAGQPYYADIDIDLGNPLWDLEGVFIHLGELLDPGKTDHLALYSSIRDSASKDFLYYTLAAAEAATGGA